MKKDRDPNFIWGWEDIAEARIICEKILEELDRLKNDDSLPLPDPQRKEAIRQCLIEKCRQIEQERENAI